MVLALALVATAAQASSAAAALGAASASIPARFRNSRRLDSADIPALSPLLPHGLLHDGTAVSVRAAARGSAYPARHPQPHRLAGRSPESQTAYRVWIAWYLPWPLVKPECCGDCRATASLMPGGSGPDDETGTCGPRSGMPYY